MWLDSPARRGAVMLVLSGLALMHLQHGALPFGPPNGGCGLTGSDGSYGVLWTANMPSRREFTPRVIDVDGLFQRSHLYPNVIVPMALVALVVVASSLSMPAYTEEYYLDINSQAHALRHWPLHIARRTSSVCPAKHPTRLWQTSCGGGNVTNLRVLQRTAFRPCLGERAMGRSWIISANWPVLVLRPR